MKGLRIIPMFLFLIALSYGGALFVEANGTLIEIRFLHYQTPSLKAGLIVLLSAFAGTIITGLLCSVEILALYVQNRKLKSKLRKLTTSGAPKDVGGLSV